MITFSFCIKILIIFRAITMKFIMKLLFVIIGLFAIANAVPTAIPADTIVRAIRSAVPDPNPCDINALMSCVGK